ncbi:MAG: hypothetical protein ABFD77_02745 [Thermotogota bacterium]
MGGSQSAAPVMLDRKGIHIGWKILLTVLGVIAGGGAGSYAMQLLLGGVASSATLDEVSTQNDSDHKEIRGTLAEQQKVTAENTTAIRGVTATVEKIESAQTRDIARAEARRLTDDIPNRKVAEREYERLFERNLQRMARGLDPCGTLACE